MAEAERPPWPALGVAARAVVRREDGRVLIIKRALEAEAYPGCWDLPGGKMEYGETLPEVLAREAREETGLDVHVGPVFHTSHFTKAPFWVTCVTFACDYSGGQVRLSEEHSDFEWIEAAEGSARDYAIGVRQQLEAYALFRS